MTAVAPVLRNHWSIRTSVLEQLLYALTASTTGAMVFGSTVYVLWRVRGDPDSAEAWSLGQTAELVGAARAKVRWDSPRRPVPRRHDAF